MAPRRVKVHDVSDVSGEANIAGRDIVKNIKTIYQRALSAAEEATHERKIEEKLLAQGVSVLARNLSAQASQTADGDTPYKGLLAYNLNEAEIFFGRQEAKKDVLRSIKRDRLTVLHAESGAGKSSLIQAGIAAQLIVDGHLAIRLRPHNDDPVEFIKRTFLPDLSQAPSLARAPLLEFLRQVCAVLGPKHDLYLLVDQFEEFFNLLKKDERKPFLESLADCLNDSSLKVRWVLALRADALSDLAELEAFGISPFKNIYRLNRLNRSEAREAIIEPAKRYGLTFEPELIDHILDSLEANGEIAPTQLQLVCSALTDEIAADQTLTLAYYTEKEGGTEGILRDYLKRQLEHLPAEEQTSAWKVLRALITADRQRAVKTHGEIIQELKISGASKKQIDTVLGRLVERRLIFTQPAMTEMFELAHDYLVKEIELDPQEQARKAAQELLDQEVRSYQRHKTLLTAERLNIIEPHRNELYFSPEAETLFIESQKSVQRERTTRERQRNAIFVGLTVIAIAMGFLASWAFRQRNEAQKQAVQSRAGELAAQSVSLRDNQPVLSLLMGVEAFRLLDIERTRTTMIDNIDSNPRVRKYLSNGLSLWSMALSPDGRTVGAAYGDDTIILWDLQRGKPIGQPLEGLFSSSNGMSFSPDGETLVSGSCGQFNDNGDCMQGEIILWDVANGEPIRSLTGHTDEVSSVAFNPNGKMLASGSRDNTIMLWDVQSGQPIGEPLKGHSDGVSSVAFSPDGKMLASGSGDNTIILWDAQSGQPVGQPLKGHLDGVASVAFSPDGKMLASGSRDNTIILWDVQSGQPIGLPLKGHLDGVASVAFSPDGKLLASGSYDNDVILWDIQTQQPIGQPLKGHGNIVWDVFFSPDGETLISGGNDGTIILWSVQGGQPIGQSVKALSGTATILAFSPDGKTLAMGSEDGTISLWNVQHGQSIGQPLKGHSHEVSSGAFSLDGKTLASEGCAKIDKDGTCGGSEIILWNLQTGQPIGQPLKGDQSDILSGAFSPDSKLYVSGGNDGSLILWDISKLGGSPVKVILSEPIHYFISGVAFSPDGKLFASGSGDDTITLWDVSKPTSPVKLHTISEQYALGLAFSPDSQRLVSGDEKGVITIWDISDLSNPTKLTSFIGHSDPIYTLVFSPDGKTLASGGYDKTIILWDMSKPSSPTKLVTLTKHSDSITKLVFGPDGRLLASQSSDSIILWNLDPQSWIQKACDFAGRNFTRAEWAQYFPNEEYHATCPQWPSDVVNPVPSPQAITTSTHYEEIVRQILSNADDPHRVKTALDKLRTEMAEDSTIKDPISESNQIVSKIVQEDIFSKVTAGDFEQSIDLLEQAKNSQLNMDDAGLLNAICWFGSLSGYATQVSQYCEQAVGLAPDNAAIHDSRGLARALTGNYTGAIEDFQFFVDQGTDQGYDESLIHQRQEWVTDLKADKNPFTPELLNQLKTQ